VVKGTYAPVFRNNVISQAPEDEKMGDVLPIQYSRSKLTLAVLPFRNLCENKEYQFFVDGFGEELTQIFSNYQDISVIAHHSTRKYLSNPDDVRIIGTELGCHYLINGSVKRTSENIKVNVGLLETFKGIQIWSNTYIYKLNIDNLIEIQDAIIQNVCSILAGYYGFIVQDGAKTYHKNTSNIYSFDAALSNYHCHMNFSMDAYLSTREALELALQQDPNYAMGMAMLSELYLDAYSLGFPTVEDPVNKGYELAKKAINLDPKCQHAYLIYGWANVYLKRKDDAMKAFEYCISLNPSSISAMGAVGFGMACAGEYQRANELLTESINFNPHCPWWFYLGFFLVKYNDKDYTKALEYANKIEAKDVYMDPLSKAIIKAQLGMLASSKADMHTFKEQYPDILNNLEMYLNTFLIDTSMVDKIMQGFTKAMINSN
jgi:TolB-like protein/Tfp pilus assembly protein PilF